MDLKWSERFSHLAAMLLSKMLSQPEPSFQPVKITPVKPPPAGAVDNTEPFFAPVKSTDRPNSAQPASAPPTATGRPSSTEQVPADLATKPTASVSGLGVSHWRSDSEMYFDSASESESLPPVLANSKEGELSDIEQDVSLTDADQALSEEQSYRETMRGIRSHMGWGHIPDIDSALSSSEDNPFAAPKQQPAGKVSVNLPTDDWLCCKMDRLNLMKPVDIHPEDLKLEVSSGIILSSRPNHKENGMAYTPVRINRLDPFHSGTLNRPS